MVHSQLDPSLHDLEQHKKTWGSVPIRAKVDLLLQTRARLSKRAADWVDASVSCKQIDPAAPWVAEEWMRGPRALAVAIDAYLDTLGALANGHLPRLNTTTHADGRVVARAFPANFLAKSRTQRPHPKMASTRSKPYSQHFTTSARCACISKPTRGCMALSRTAARRST